jgi:hypothetical protein
MSRIIMTTSGRIATVALTLMVGLHAGAPRARAQNPDVVIQWNEVMQSLHGTGASDAQRSYAMLHIAMFDAVNSIVDTYTPYRVHVRGSRGASQTAAAAQAAHDILTALFPGAQERFDALRASQLRGVPRGVASQGLAIGRRAARAILAWRQNDGWPPAIVPDPTYDLPPFPGLWQPTPLALSPATFTFYSNVIPFALLTSTQFLPPPPPTLTSDRYAEDFNEVKELGSAASPLRTDEETRMARLIAGVNTSTGFLHVWNLAAREASRSQGLSLVAAARLFALVNVSLHDGLQTSFTSKFVYGLWRPVTAVRRAGEDLNDATQADPAWTPLLTTPPYPTYAGNAACLSAAAARALALGLGTDAVPFSITWNGTAGNPNETRDYTSFSALAEQQARSRVLGGIHFQFDSDASQSACAKVGEFVHGKYMLPRK